MLLLCRLWNICFCETQFLLTWFWNGSFVFVHRSDLSFTVDVFNHIKNYKFKIASIFLSLCLQADSVSSRDSVFWSTHCPLTAQSSLSNDLSSRLVPHPILAHWNTFSINQSVWLATMTPVIMILAPSRCSWQMQYFIFHLSWLEHGHPQS